MKLKTRPIVKATLITTFLLTFTLTSTAQTPFVVPLEGAVTSTQGPPQEPYTGVFESPSRSAIPSQVEPVSVVADDVSQVYLPDVPLPAASDINGGAPRVHIQGEFVDFQENSNASSMLPQGSANANDSQASPTAVTTPLLQAANNSPDSNAPGDNVVQWSGVGNSGWFPPDTVGAVGPTHVVEAVNSGFAIWNKAGTLTQAYRTFDSFMNKPAGWAGSMFDPRIVYDSISNHFVMLIIGKDDTNAKSYIWIAISQTTDPNGTWNLHRYDTTDTSGSSTAWLDYAGLGVDANGVYFTGNYFYFSGGYRGSTLWNLNPAMLTGGANNGWVWKDLKWPSGSSAFTIQPALPHSVNSNNESYFVNTHSGSGSEVLLWKLAGTFAPGRSLTKVVIPISPYDAIGNNVDQPGSTTDIDGGDARVMNAVYANRRVFFTLTDDVNSDGASSGAYTVKLNSDTNTKEWDSLYWGGAGKYVTYPAVTLQGSGVDNNLGIFSSWTDGTSIYASSVFAFYDNQPNAGVSYAQFLENGLAPYVRVFSGRNRWGDYSGAAYDWSTGDFWGFAERSLTGNTWGTTVSRRDAGGPPVPQIAVTVPNGGQTWGSGTTQTVTWTRNDLPSTDEIEIWLDLPDYGTQTKLVGSLSTALTSYSVTVPEKPTTNAKIIVASYNPTNTDQTSSGYTIFDYSDAVFTIVDQTPPSPNPMTFSSVPHQLSTSQIAMTATIATDPSGGVEYYFQYTSSPTAGPGGGSSGWQVSSSYTDSGLGPNEDYCYEVYAHDTYNNLTSPSAIDCDYTDANQPVLGSFSNITQTSITVNLGADGNPAGTEYWLRNATTGQSQSWSTSKAFVNSGLSCGTTYTYGAWSMNGDSAFGAEVVLGNASTLSCPDTDGDGIQDSLDNCILVANPTQCDGDGDNYGNHCDADFNNDLIVNGLDIGPLKAGFGTANPVTDLNCDGITNGLDIGPFKTMFGSPPGPSGLVP